jgi:RNA polymerase sigma-70 factor (ECF subfamily)
MERIELSETTCASSRTWPARVTAVELLDELPRDQRAALRARLVDERAYGEIAGAEGVSEAAIRQRVSRGLAGLRRRMRGDP